MDGKRVYLIEINGIKESIDAVESLNQKLLDLSNRIDELNNKQINIAANTNAEAPAATTTPSSSRKAELSEEERVLEEIEKVERKIAEARTKQYQGLLEAKRELKEIRKEQESANATLNNRGEIFDMSTMKGMKEALKSIKQEMQTTDLGSDRFKELVKQADELNSKLKEIEQSYGQFGRNVGNYSSAFEGLKKISVVVGDTTREFNSARDASRQLEQELKAMVINGQENTEQFKELSDAVHNFEMKLKKADSAVNDLKVSSTSMDNLLDLFQSFTALGSVTNGFSAVFGFDDTEISKSIQKLVGLQSVLQGIEKIRQQMKTGEGIGKILTKSFDPIDKYTNRLLAFNRAIIGTGNAAKAASLGIKAMSIALKGLVSIGIGAFITLLSEGISKVGELFTKWVKGNADLVNSEMRLKSTMESINDTLQRRLELNQRIESAKGMTAVQRRIADEKAYAEAIEASNTELKRRADYNPDNTTFAKSLSGEKTWKSFLEEDKGVTTFGGFTEASKNIDELTKRYDALSEAVDKNTRLTYKNAKGIEIAHLSASDAKDELNHIEQFMSGQLVRTMNQFNLKTDEGREAASKWVNEILNSDNDLRKSILLRLPEIVSNEDGNLADALDGWLKHVKDFAKASDAAMKQLDFKQYAQQIIESADETGKAAFDRQRQELKEHYESLSNEEQNLQKETYEKALKSIDELEKKKRDKVSSNYSKLQKAVDNAENELTRLRIENMKDGLTKTIAQLNFERTQRIQEAKRSGKYIGEKILEINKLYDENVFEAKVAHHNAMIEEEKRYAKELESVINATSDRAYENSIKRNKLRQNAPVTFNGYNEISGTNKNLDAYFKYKDEIDALMPNLNIDFSDKNFKQLMQINKAVKESYQTIRRWEEWKEKLKNSEELELFSIEELDENINEAQKKFDEALKAYNNFYKKVAKDDVSGMELRAWEDEISDTLSESYALRTKAREKFFSESLESYKKYLEKEEQLEIGRVNDITDRRAKEENERYTKTTSNVFITDIEEVQKQFEIIRKQVDNVSEDLNKGVIAALNPKQAGKYFEDYINQFNKWIDDVRSGLRKGEKDWADYKEFFESSNFQSYQKVYDDYAEFMKQYSKLSVDEQKKQAPEQKKRYDELVKAYTDYVTKVENESKVHQNALKTIESEGRTNILEIQNDFHNKSLEAQSYYYQQMLNNTDDALNAVSNRLSKKVSNNQLDFLTPIKGLKELKDDKETLKAAYAELLKEKDRFTEDFKKGNISLVDFENLQQQSKILFNQLKQLNEDVKNRQNNLVMALTDAINLAVQTSLQSVQTLMNAYADYENYQFDKIQEQINKTNEMLQKKLDEQEEIVQKHKENVDSIEDELATARGDRRQYLIDQLNNEILAQREAAAEEARIKKQQEAMEIKQEKLDKKRKEKEYKNNLANILISTAMATANGLATQPFVPVGIAMGSLATALGMIQYELARRQKPYKKGGLLEGPSHENGGIKVYGGYAELEGHEYIINKSTTTKNEQLLEYINSKKKRINLSDMIEFFNDKPRKVVSNIAKTHFAEGGILNSPATMIETADDRILNALEKYSNRPSIVSVVDIQNKMDDVTYVKALAGLNN